MPSTIYFIAFSVNHTLCPCVVFFPYEISSSFLYATEFLTSVTASVTTWLLLFSSLRCDLDFTSSEYYLPFQFDVNLGQIFPHLNIPQNHCTYVTAVGLGPWYAKPMVQIYTASVAVIQWWIVMVQCFWIIA